MIDYVDKILKDVWGPWQREGEGITTGYPTMDMIQMAKEGGRGSGLKNAPENPEAEYLDCLICDLTKKQIKSLKAKYIWEVTEREAAEIFHITKSTHQCHIYDSHKRLDRILTNHHTFKMNLLNLIS